MLIFTMGRRIFLFLLTNLAIVLTLSVVLSVLGVGQYVGPGGLDIQALALFCLVWGMGGAFISLQLSRWMAKRATGVKLVDGRTGQADLDWHLHAALRIGLERAGAHAAAPQIDLLRTQHIDRRLAVEPGRGRRHQRQPNPTRELGGVLGGVDADDRGATPEAAAQ